MTILPARALPSVASISKRKDMKEDCSEMDVAIQNCEFEMLGRPISQASVMTITALTKPGHYAERDLYQGKTLAVSRDAAKQDLFQGTNLPAAENPSLGALYQGTTSVVPQHARVMPGFSPCTPL